MYFLYTSPIRLVCARSRRDASLPTCSRKYLPKLSQIWPNQYCSRNLPLVGKKHYFTHFKIFSHLLLSESFIFIQFVPVFNILDKTFSDKHNVCLQLWSEDAAKSSLLTLTVIMCCQRTPLLISVLPLSVRPAVTICWGLGGGGVSPLLHPLIFFSSSSCVLWTSTLPPAALISVQPPCFCYACAPHFRFCVTLWPCPPPSSPSLPAIPPKPVNARPPNLLALPSTASPFGFCWGANNCYQQDPHKIPAWSLLWGPQWQTGSNGH